MEIFKDKLYSYIYEIDQNCVFIELNLNDEDKRKLKKIPFAPIINRNILRRAAVADHAFVINNDFKISLQYLFSGCTSLEDVSVFQDFNFSAVTWFNGMFENCVNLTNIGPFMELGQRIIAECQYFAGMFDGCFSLGTYPGIETKYKHDIYNLLFCN
jgi:hypothetical protein